MINANRILLWGALVVMASACADASNAAGGADAAPGNAGEDAASDRVDAAPIDHDAAPGESDLVVTEAYVEPTQVDEGAIATVYARVQNHGEASGEATLELEVEGSVEKTQSVSVNAPGEDEDPKDTEVQAEFSISRDQAGSYELAVSGEPAGTLEVIQPNADIVVVSADASPREIEQDEEATVTATVQNQGDAEGDKTLELEVDGTAEKSKTVTVEAPGENQDPADTEVEVEFSFSREEAGDYALSVSAESAGTVTVLEGPEFSGYEIVSKKLELSAGSFQRVATSCSADAQEALSGGIRVIDAASSEPDTRVQYSAPERQDGRAHWVVGISNVGSESEQLEAYATCAEPPPGFAIERKQISIADGDYQEDEVACASEGHVALGGGIDFLGTGEPGTRLEHTNPVAASNASPDAWEHGVSNQGGSSRDLEASVFCAEPMAGYDIVEEDHHELDSGQFDKIRPRCFGDEVILSGGIHSGSDADTRIRYAYPGEFKLDAAWRIGVSNEGFGTEAILAYALCSNP